MSVAELSDFGNGYEKMVEMESRRDRVIRQKMSKVNGKREWLLSLAERETELERWLKG